MFDLGIGAPVWKCKISSLESGRDCFSFFACSDFVGPKRVSSICDWFALVRYFRVEEALERAEPVRDAIV